MSFQTYLMGNVLIFVVLFKIYSNAYILVSIPMNWSDAESYCVNHYNSHLASIHTQYENNEVATLCSFQYGRCWIGYNDIMSNINWEWTDCSSNTFSHWHPAQPANNDQHCALTHGYNYYSSSYRGHWNDGWCTRIKNHSICNDPPDIITGLVAYYLFNNNAKDSTSNGFDGFVYNAIPTDDRFGNSDSAYWFDGTAHIVLDPAIPIQKSFSIILSVYNQQQWVNKQPVLDLWTDWRLFGEDGSGETWLSGGGIEFGFYDGNTRKGIGYTTTEKEKWWQFGITYNNELNQTSFYVDGTLIGTHTVSVRNLNGDSIWIGRQHVVPNSYFLGKIDDIFIYNRTLNIMEIQQFTKNISLPMTTNPTSNPSAAPTKSPSQLSSSPTQSPTIAPSAAPSLAPTITTTGPSSAPSLAPTINPTQFPTNNPSTAPSYNPSIVPSVSPTFNPTLAPTNNPSI
eukprot:366635_1